MKNMKTLLAVIVALCLVMSLSIPVLATEVTDNTASTPTTAATEGATTAASEPTAAATEEVATDEEAAEPTHIHEDGTVHADSEHAEAETTDTETETTGTETAKGEAGWKKPVRVVLIVLEVIFSIALAVVVLMQSGKESGLSGAISGNNDSYMSKSGKGGLDKILAKSTKWVALIWLVVTLALSLI